MGYYSVIKINKLIDTKKKKNMGETQNLYTQKTLGTKEHTV